MSRLMDTVRAVNRTRRVEDSVRLRQATLATVMIAVLAVWSAGAAPMVDAVAALVLLPVGAVVSWRRAGRDNFGLKFLIAVGAVAALARFFAQLRGASSVDDAREPLTALFLAVQVLHGFDLPARRDLGFTLASSLTLIALAGTNANTGVFLVLLLAYAAVAVVSMVEVQRSAARERADLLVDEGRVRLGGVAATGSAPGRGSTPVALNPRWMVAALRPTASVLGVGLLLFSIIPRSDTRQVGTLEFRSIPTPFTFPSGLVNNLGLDGGGLQEPVSDQAPIGFNPTAYFGFAQNVDLRTVGELSDEPVMRVRADRPRLWRGVVFDTYTGVGWTRGSEEPGPTRGRPVELPTTVGSNAAVDSVTQTFELLTDTPNLVFAAADASRVFVGGGSVNHWDDGTMTTGQLMEEGTVYSVISDVVVSAPETLRAVDTSNGRYDEVFFARWTQLPDSVPDRVHDLAARITAGATTGYAKAEAVQAWLGANVEYSLDGVPPPDTADAVDHFLFEARIGWCEPIAASMVVMLRSVGVPARFATGFQPGRRNPFTGAYDVRMNNAHAWVEMYVPAHGWISFDPTGAVPLAVAADAPLSLPLLDAITWVREELARRVPEPVARAVSRVASTAGDHAVELSGAAVALLAAALAWRRRRARLLALAAIPTDAFGRLAHRLAGDELGRRDWQTPREWLTSLRWRRPDLPPDALATLIEVEETRRYAPPGTPVDEAAADDAVERIERALVGD